MLGTVSGETTTRRPLKSRGTAWAGYFSRAMLAAGLRPNAVSLIGIAFAALAGAAMIQATRIEPSWALWIAAAAGVQLRLFCNLMDGLLAVEGGLKSPTGELFNELPDRLEDALILVPLGYAGGTDWSIALGWAAACGAVATAPITSATATARQAQARAPRERPHKSRPRRYSAAEARTAAIHTRKPPASGAAARWQG